MRTAGEVSPEEVRRITAAYAERESALAGSSKRDPANQGNHWRMHEHRERLRHILGTRLERPLAECRVLDVGCGYGGLLAWFHGLGVPSGNLTGVDLLPNRIRVAREAHPQFSFMEANAEHLDLADDSFDLVAAFTVFSSILDPKMARNVAQSIRRVLKSDGAVIWYDVRYPNPWNRHLRAMTRGRIQELFGPVAMRLESVTLLPPLGRRLGRSTDRIYPLLAGIPILRSHYIGLLLPGRD
jgi:ubiquinone/menaquinone biosynthesis C-methylase UbiE